MANMDTACIFCGEETLKRNHVTYDGAIGAYHNECYRSKEKSIHIKITVND